MGVGIAVLLNFFLHRPGDLFRSVMQFSRQALEVQVIPMIQVANPHKVVGQGAAGDDQNPVRLDLGLGFYGLG